MALNLSGASWGGLHLNPGAAGRSGFHKVCTMLKFDVLDGSIDNMKLVEWARWSPFSTWRWHFWSHNPPSTQDCISLPHQQHRCDAARAPRPSHSQRNRMFDIIELNIVIMLKNKAKDECKCGVISPWDVLIIIWVILINILYWVSCIHYKT